MVEVADIISLIVDDFEGNKKQAVDRVGALIAKYPIYE
jgi:hypothetical protein